MSLKQHLDVGVSGGGLLFCGSGFSADCLNFNADELGASPPLLKLLNEKLNYTYTDMQVAADDFLEQHGEYGLLKLLSEQFTVQHHIGCIQDILNYPWSRIYTTNYDSVISETFLRMRRQHVVVNNLDDPEDIEAVNGRKKTWVVHLHGALAKWDIRDFARSCVLGQESYLRISRQSPWTSILREDYAAAAFVCFVGFSNSDFYLAQNLFSAEAAREKVFFINMIGAATNRELIGRQKKFGTPLAIGKEEFASLIKNAAQNKVREALNLVSFRKCELPQLPDETASVEVQEQFIINGVESPAFLYKDVFTSSSSYRARRQQVDDIVELLEKENSVALVVGGICSGKSTILEECKMLLRMRGREVFYLHSKFYGLETEVSEILEMHPKCCLVIDDCFSLSNLENIIRETNSVGANLLLASRSLARDSRQDIQDFLTDETSYESFDTEILYENEINTLIDCTDRIGGWESDVSDRSQKRRIVETEGSFRLSGFLLHLFKSPHIKNRFLSELDVVRAENPSAEKVIILALYLKHVGENIQENILAEMLGDDPIALLRGTSKERSFSNSFISYDARLGKVNVIPSINARNALVNFFSSSLVREFVIEALKNIAPVRKIGIYRHVFSQLMRYTQLKGVVRDKSQQNEFFDRLSELPFCRSHVLFWLQWSMAMRDHGEYAKAKQYLDQGFGIAKGMEGFDPHQLEDQETGLYIDAILPTAEASDFFRVFGEIMRNLRRLLGRENRTSHPYMTIAGLDKFFEKAEGKISPIYAKVYVTGLLQLETTVSRQIRDQRDGYIKLSMERAVATIQNIVSMLKQIQ